MADVSLKILDSQTGQPIPCWICLAKLTGENLTPTGWLTGFPTAPGEDVGGRVSLAGKIWIAISGECELPANQGECLLGISSAPGYQETTYSLNLFAGRLAVRLSVPTPDSGLPENFIAADFRSHSISAGVALLEARAGNLQMVQILASQTLPGDSRKPNLVPLAEASGLSSLVLNNGCLVSWGTLNRQAKSGNLALLDCHRPVFPLVIDESNRGFWSAMDWTAQCHRIRGLTVWADCDRDHGHQSEMICAALEGELDCFEVVDLCENRLGGLALWYALADAGIFLPLVGASAKDSNAIPTGYLRTVFPVPGGKKAFSLDTKSAQEAWVLGIKSGSSAVTKWPFLFTREIQVDGHSCSVTTEIGPLDDQMLVEWVHPNGQILLSKPLFPALTNQVVSGEVLGRLPSRLGARLRNSLGELIAHESFHNVCNPDGGEPRIDTEGVRQLVDRLKAGLQWIDREAQPKAEGEMLYRKNLFSKWLEKLGNLKTA